MAEDKQAEGPFRHDYEPDETRSRKPSDIVWPEADILDPAQGQPVNVAEPSEPDDSGN